MLRVFSRVFLAVVAMSFLYLPTALAEGDPKVGAQVYKLNCAACHGANLQGGIAPALKGNTLIMSGDDAKVLEVISEGRTDKGMPAWKDQLQEQQIMDIVALLKNPDAVPQEAAIVEVAEPDISTDDIFPGLQRSFLFVYLWTIISMTVLLVWIRQRK